MQSTLFLAYPYTDDLALAFSRANPELVRMFTNGHPDYLEKIQVSSGEFIGKRAGELIDLQKLHSLKEHITSLLHRLAPHLLCREEEFTLLTLFSPPSE